MTDTFLSIVIPTYLRAASSVLNYPQFLDEAADLGVAIYISDDSPDDSIQQLFEARRAAYPNIFYRRNVPALKHDRNVVSSLLWPQSTFTWILGDSFRTSPGALGRIVDALEDQDFYFINWNSSDGRMIKQLTDEDAAAFLVDRVWHQALTGATIYHDRVRCWLQQESREFHPNFPQLDVVLGYANEHQPSLGWHGERVLVSTPKGSSYWTQQALDVFVGDWASVLAAYPRAIPQEQLADVIASHSANTGLFNLAFLTTLRASGHLDRAAVRRPYFWDAMHVPRAQVLALVLIPSALIKPLVAASRAVRARVQSRSRSRLDRLA